MCASNTVAELLERIQTRCIPAQIGSKDVEELFPGQEGVEDAAVGTIDHVALVRGPPVHLPVGDKRNRW